MMFDNEIKNKIFLITGVNGQIGSLLCETIIDRGGLVLGLDIEINKIQSLSRKKKWSSDLFLFLKTDISNEKKTKINFNLGLKKFKKINFLVNNAGVSIFTNWKNRTEKDIDFVTNVNLKGTINLIKIFSLYLKNKKKFGAIVNVASHYGIVSPDPRIYTDCKRRNSEIYGATKAGVIQITKYFATNSKYDGIKIRINAVAPGGILNEKNPQGKDFQKRYSSKCPDNRMGSAIEVVWPILFLLSKKASYINGHTLVIDGGFTAW
mgnify:FL=1